jgi:hypothetical protein
MIFGTVQKSPLISINQPRAQLEHLVHVVIVELFQLWRLLKLLPNGRLSKLIVIIPNRPEGYGLFDPEGLTLVWVSIHGFCAPVQLSFGMRHDLTTTAPTQTGLLSKQSMNIVIFSVIIRTMNKKYTSNISGFKAARPLANPRTLGTLECWREAPM